MANARQMGELADPPFIPALLFGNFFAQLGVFYSP